MTINALLKSDPPMTYFNVQSETQTSPNNNIKLTKNPPPFNKEAWEAKNTKFANINRDSQERLKTKSEEPESYIEELNNILPYLLQSKQKYQHEAKEYFRHSKYRNRHPPNILRTENLPK